MKAEEVTVTNNQEMNTGHQAGMREGPFRIIQELEGKEIINGRTGMVTMRDMETDRSIQGTIEVEI